MGRRGARRHVDSADHVLAEAVELDRASLAVAVLAFLRFPDGTPDLPALSPALAISLAWLLVWSYQRPWYDVMAICLLAVYPASRLDWLVLGRLILTAPVYLPGVPGPIPAWLNNTINVVGYYVAPDARLAAAVAFVVLCLTGRWGWRERVTVRSLV